LAFDSGFSVFIPSSARELSFALERMGIALCLSAKLHFLDLDLVYICPMS
jgi:phycobilisome core linker protein